MSRSALVATVVLAAGILPRLALAQEAPDPADRPAQGAPARTQDLRAQVAAIRKQLDELRSSSAQAQTAAGSIQQLSSRVTALEQRVGRLGRQGAAGPELTAAIDRLSAQAAALERDVEGLRTQVAGIEQPAAGTGAGGVEHGRGFEWTTGDGAYSLRLGGFVQPRYEVSLAEGGDTVNRATFRLRRGRLVLGGHAGRDELTYKVQLETTLNDAAALDYYVDYEIWPELAVRAGQDKVFFTRAWWASDSSIDVIERPASVDALRYDRDIGLWAHGELLGGRLSYHAGVSNGGGPNKRNDNIDTAMMIRAEAALLGARFEPLVGNLTADPELRLTVGAGAVHDLVAVPVTVGGMTVANRDVDADGEVDNVRVVSSSVDATLRWQGLELMVEGIWRHERWGTIVEHADNQPIAVALEADSEGHRNYLGGYVYASYALLPETLQMSARVGQSRVTLLGIGGRLVDVPPPGDRLVEANGQVRWFHGDLSVGASYTLLNYNNRNGPELAGDIEHLLIGQAQLNF